jgi:hypothetical protein
MAQNDGKILVSQGGNGSYAVHRFNTDGSQDGGFSTPSCSSSTFALEKDQKILIVQSNSLVRLNPDGRLDNTFSAAVLTNGIVGGYFVLRHNGKVLAIDGASLSYVNEDGTVVDGESVTQLNEDGSVDSNFNFHNLDLRYSLDEPDGTLLTADSVGSRVVATRLDPAGISNSNFASFSLWPVCDGRYPTTLALGVPGQLFMFGSFNDVDGFPRRGLARLLTNPPDRDFRVFTPAEFLRSSGVGRVRVVRTGPTTNGASVSFRTSDATAKAGVDYVPQSGTLNFAPLEVCKEVAVSLLTGTGTLARIAFNLELNNPSAGYTTIAATPIIIDPDLWLATKSLRGSIAVTLYGTIPGIGYSFESSTNLTDWLVVSSDQATGPTVVFKSDVTSSSRRFFRARRE